MPRKQNVKTTEKKIEELEKKIETIQPAPMVEPKPKKERKQKLKVVIPQEEKDFEPTIKVEPTTMVINKKPNKWLSFLADFRTKNPELTYKECLQKGKLVYNQ
jgi:hypothetical protein